MIELCATKTLDYARRARWMLNTMTSCGKAVADICFETIFHLRFSRGETQLCLNNAPVTCSKLRRCPGEELSAPNEKELAEPGVLFVPNATNQGTWDSYFILPGKRVELVFLQFATGSARRAANWHCDMECIAQFVAERHKVKLLKVQLLYVVSKETCMKTISGDAPQIVDAPNTKASFDVSAAVVVADLELNLQNL